MALSCAPCEASSAFSAASSIAPRSPRLAPSPNPASAMAAMLDLHADMVESLRNGCKRLAHGDAHSLDALETFEDQLRKVMAQRLDQPEAAGCCLLPRQVAEVGIADRVVQLVDRRVGAPHLAVDVEVKPLAQRLLRVADAVASEKAEIVDPHAID